MTTIPQQIRVNIEFINAKCNNVGFVFDNDDNELRNANVINVVYNLIRNYCETNIYNNVKQQRSVDDLIFLCNGKEILTENTFNDLSPTSKNYNIHVVFRLLGDQKLMEEMELRKALGIGGYGRRKSKKGTKKRTKKYCSKCKSKKSRNHKHKNTYKNK